MVSAPFRCYRLVASIVPKNTAENVDQGDLRLVHVLAWQ